MSTEVTHYMLLDELQSLYDTESQMASALPGMAEMATLPRLKRALEGQLAGTRNQLQRLARLLADLGGHVAVPPIRTLGRLIDDGGRLAFATGSALGLNREMIKLARYVEQFEIIACGCAIAYADLLGYVDVVRVLRATLDEKEETERQLAWAALPEPASITGGWSWV